MIILLFALLLPAPAQADDLTFQLEPVIFSAPASFETLGEETFVPKQSTPIEPTRFSVVKRIGDDQMFPEANLGFPAGVSGVKYGGRSVDDTQVSTLGVPLNLPQGGGADLSIFPSFLWSRADLTRTPIASGYAPTSASGAINLELWTRDQILRRRRPEDPDSRVTASYDRQVQNISIATRQRAGVSNIAINGGMNYGLQTGPSGSLSYEFYRDSISTWRFHLLATDQSGNSPGSKRFPTPQAKMDSWRVIPILETQRTLGGDWIWESTWFGDLSGILLNDPADASAYSNSRTQQYGTENAFLVDDYTFALSGRFVRFVQDDHTDQYGYHPGVSHQEWPILVSASRLFRLSPTSEVKVTALTSAVTSIGMAPGGRVSAKVSDVPDGADYWFFELFSTPKMPTINARYYQLPPLYSGNPDLKPERIYSAIAGREQKYRDWSLRTALKGESRRDVQIDRNNTTVNAGTAQLLYLDQQVTWAATGRLDLRGNVLLSLSHLQDADIPYPDLPAVALKARAIYHFADELELEGRAHYQGPSVAAAFPAGGRFHPNYTLFDLEARFALDRNLQFQAGIENLTNQFAEVVLDYPLPGRLYYLGLQLLL